MNIKIFTNESVFTTKPICIIFKICYPSKQFIDAFGRF